MNTPLLLFVHDYSGSYIWPEFEKIWDALLCTGSDSEPFVKDILGIIFLLQLLESRIILTEQGLSLILHDNTVFFLRTVV